MIKICFVLPRAYYLFNPHVANIKDKIGGAQKQSFLFSKELAKNKNFEVHFIVADFGQSDVELYHNVKVWKSFNFTENIIWRIKKFIKSLKKIDSDIYIFRSADIGVSLATLYLKGILKKRVIYMLAGESELSFKSLKLNQGILTALTMPITYRCADKIIAQTKNQSRLFSKIRRVDSVITNVIKVSNEKVQVSGKNVVLWIGRLTKIKKPELFIDLANNFPTESFLMIAPFEHNSTNYGTKIIKKAKQIKNLKLINYVKPNEIEEYYKKAKLYVITSESEGFSNTMMEAMNFGCPILSYKVNPDEIFNTYKVGLCSNGQDDIFFKDFQYLMGNNNLRTELTENGHNYIKNNHSIKTNTEKLIQVIMDIKLP